MDLITQHTQITLDHLQREAHEWYATKLAPVDKIMDAPWTLCTLSPGNMEAENLYSMITFTLMLLPIWLRILWLSLIIQGFFKKKGDKVSFAYATTCQQVMDKPSMVWRLLGEIDLRLEVSVKTLQQQIKIPDHTLSRIMILTWYLLLKRSVERCWIMMPLTNPF